MRPSPRRAYQPGFSLPPRLLVAAGVLFSLTCIAAPAKPQPSVGGMTGANSLMLDPSIRATGMGRASGAVFWGDGSDYWANAALLASGNWIRFERGRTQLVPELAKDVYLTTNRVTFARGGLGLLVAGYPIDAAGGSRLDYGVETATDVDGNPVGQIHPYEKTRSLGISGNILELVESVSAISGRRWPGLSRFADLGLGIVMNRTHVDLSPAGFTVPKPSADVSTYDKGLLARLTPYDAVDHEGFARPLDRVLPIRVDLAYGASSHNYTDARVDFPSPGSPIVRLRRIARSVHAALGFPGVARDALDGAGLGWLPASLTPLVSWGRAWEGEVEMIKDPATGDYIKGPEARYDGWEVTIANIYTYRQGHIEDPAGSLFGDTKGWSLGVHLKDLGGFSYEEATEPPTIYFTKTIHRKGFSVFVDPVKAWRAIRGSRGGARSDAGVLGRPETHASRLGPEG